jgi:hypothetical protein
MDKNNDRSPLEVTERVGLTARDTHTFGLSVNFTGLSGVARAARVLGVLLLLIVGVLYFDSNPAEVYKAVFSFVVGAGANHIRLESNDNAKK